MSRRSVVGRDCREEPGGVAYAFGPNPKQLSREDMETATFHERIESVWPFLVRRVQEWVGTLSPRERANTDHEDALVAVVEELAIKDVYWDASRGKYITFASAVADRRLVDLRDESHTVQSPHNSSAMLSDSGRDISSENYTPRKGRVARQIMGTRAIVGIQDRSSRSHGGCDPSVREPESHYGDPADQVASHEYGSDMVEAMLEQIKFLNPYESVVIGAKYGLWGQEPKTYKEIAESIKTDEDRVKRICANAREKIRAGMESRGAVPIKE